MNIVIIILLVIMAISTVAAWLICRTKKVDKAVKVMFFVLYFWVYVFAQLMIFALLYHLEIVDVSL